MAWLALASPNEQSTMASSGRSAAKPMRRARARLKASPVALGRWLAIVEVCGGTQSGRLPHTLCRPCRDRVVRDSPRCRAGCRRPASPRELARAGHHQRTGAVVQEGGIVDAQLRAEHDVVLVTGRCRSCRSCGSSSSARAPRRRSARLSTWSSNRPMAVAACSVEPAVTGSPGASRRVGAGSAASAVSRACSTIGTRSNVIGRRCSRLCGSAESVPA